MEHISYEWDAKGKRRIRFTDGSFKNVLVKNFLYDTHGHPIVVLSENGWTYPWANIISIGPPK